MLMLYKIVLINQSSLSRSVKDFKSISRKFISYKNNICKLSKQIQFFRHSDNSNLYQYSKRHFCTDNQRTRLMASQHEVPLDSPIYYLKSEEAFSGLTVSEKKFVHYLSRASWWGGLIVLCQKSPESPVIFNLLTRVFRCQPLGGIKDMAISKAGFTEEDYNSLLVYFCGFLYNFGNFLGFGDKKIVPTVSKEKLVKFVKASKAYLEAPDELDSYLNNCLEPLYSLEENDKFLGLPPKGVTMYFTPNCTVEDSEIVKEYMVSKNFEPWNSRLIKHEKNGEIIYDIRIASIDKGHLPGITVEKEKFKGHTMCISRGDYAFALGHLIEELKFAKQYANDLEKQMIDKYIESFTTGSIKAHKEGSTFWVKNKSPAVESYMGFIEVYADPTNLRAEFESFVAIVNREQSRKLDTLVERAEKDFLPLLPWKREFEEDIFMKPDFSSLDIVTFASAGLPIGINIPNYKDVKEEEGFKNVTLCNVLAARSGIKGGPFITDADHALQEKHGAIGLEIKVALHELLGHGCGKFLRRKDDGTLNFDPAKVKNPFTGGEVTFYETGQNYQTEFSSLSSAYEECRAETVALCLGLEESVMDLFSVPLEERKDLQYSMWMDMFYSGLKGLESYQLVQKKWGQAHSHARFVLMNVAIEAGIVTLVETTGADGLPDLLLTLDKSKIYTDGRKAMDDFLNKLQVYRSMADSKNGLALFQKYSEVPEEGNYPFAKWHDIVIRKRRPRLMLTMPNTRLQSDKVELVSYPDGPVGLIESWLQRFEPKEYDEIEKYLTEFARNYKH